MTDEKKEPARPGLGRAIEVRRVQMGLKRNDLKERSGLSYPYISELERGRKEPSAKALRQIADALEMGVAELMAMGTEYEEVAAQTDTGEPPSEGRVFVKAPHSAPGGSWTRVERPVGPSDVDWSPPATIGDQELTRQIRAVVREELTRVVNEDLRPVIVEEIRRALGGLADSPTEQ